MEGRDNSNSKFLDDDNSTSLPNLSGLSSVKRREPQPGPHSKSEISESKVPMQNDDNSTSLPNLSGLSSVKGREPQPGPHSKPEKSESKVSMQNDEQIY
jgi:hypothetical protein